MQSHQPLADYRIFRVYRSSFEIPIKAHEDLQLLLDLWWEDLAVLWVFDTLWKETPLRLEVEKG